MIGAFSVLPPTASTQAVQMDRLFVFLLLVTGGFFLLIVALVTYFSIKYRRGSGASRANRSIRTLPFEIAWSTIPLALAMAMFGWGAHLYLDLERPPPDSLSILVTAKQWMWIFTHSDGRREINVLHVPANVNVRLWMTSEDVIHSFFVPAFRVKQDVVPGLPTSIWFNATKPGTYDIFCAEYCGTGHSDMHGTVVVQEPRAYAQWLQAGAGGPTPAKLGLELVHRLGCLGCHAPGAPANAPSLTGLAGTQVALDDGRVVAADPAYLRRSITDPAADIVAGYRPIMPSYATSVTPAELDDIVAWLMTGAPLEESPP